MQIEIGTRYVRRDGTVSSTIVRSSGQFYPFKDPVTQQTYTDTGYVLSAREHRDADLISEYIEPVSTSGVSGKESTVEYDLSGIPEGYSFVGYRFVKVGDQYVSSVGGTKVFVATEGDVTLKRLRIIVKPITPPEPKQRTVVIHKWLVWDLLGKERMVFGTERYIGDCGFSDAVNLGLYEEVKVNV